MRSGDTISNHDQLSVEHQLSLNGCRVRLSGVLDEQFRPDLVLEALNGADPVVLDLNGVDRITSYGVREWVKMLTALPATYYCFINVRPTLVSQFNMIMDFGGRGELVSFYAPYFCESCDHSIEELVDLRKNPKILEATNPETTCDKCGNSAEFEDAPSSYFSFVQEAPSPSPPPPAQALIDGSSVKKPGPFRVRGTVEDGVTCLWMQGVLDENARLRRIAKTLQGTVIAEMSSVSEIQEGGLQRFQKFLNAASAPVYLARLSTPAALALAETDTLELGENRISSLSLPFRCKACSWEGELLVESPGEALVSDAPLQTCPECRSLNAQVNLKEAVKHKLRNLPCAELPEVARSYLSKNVKGPRSQTKALPRNTSSGLALMSTLEGRYRLEERIGAGGMGTVYRAKQTNVDRDVAIKVLAHRLCADEEFVGRFENEAKIISRLRHPNTLKLIDFSKTESGQLYIVTEYLRGEPLDQLLTKGPIGLERTLEILKQLCFSLEEAHSQGIIHRDLKPANIFLEQVGDVEVVKVLDFGIAKINNGPTLTLTHGVVIGTPAYMSPEQAMGKKVDPRADLYSLGVIAYECLSGQKPFNSENQVSLLFKQVNDIPAPLHTLDLNIESTTPALEDIVMRLLEKSPQARPASAEQLRLELESLAAPGPNLSEAALSEPAPAILKPPEMQNITAPEMVSTELNEKVSPPTSNKTALVLGLLLAVVVLLGLAFFGMN